LKAQAVLCTVCSLFLLHVLQGNAWANSRVSTDKDTYAQGDQIRVHFSGAPGIGSDWICIVHAGAPDTAAGDYKYLPEGAGRGVLTFTAPGPGDYEVRAYYNYRRNGYVVSARHTITVNRGWSSRHQQYRRKVHDRSMLSTDREVYTRGDRIRVHFSGAPGLSSDWICIVRAGAPDTAAGIYQYMPNGVREGHLTFRARRPGTYEVRAYYNYRRNGYVVSARHVFSVIAPR